MQMRKQWLLCAVFPMHQIACQCLGKDAVDVLKAATLQKLTLYLTISL